MQYLASNKSTEKGYSYRIHLLWNRKPQLVRIAPTHVDIVWDEKAERVRCPDGRMRAPFSRSNLVPERMFPDAHTLSAEQIQRIIHILEATGFESYEVA